MKRRLPMLVERAVAEVKALQAQTGMAFEQKLRAQDTWITCKVGCSNCCHHPFLVTIAEGLLLYRWLVSHGRWTPSLRKRVEQTRDKTLGLAFEIWLLSNIPCPLLEDRKCSAYEARPLHCRATFSTGDPEMCHPHELGGDTRLVQSTETIVMFNSKVRGLLKRVGVTAPLMPLAEAVLLGEAIDAGNMEIEDTDLHHAKDLLRA
jgi:Fe-S-cluster containining protein